MLAASVTLRGIHSPNLHDFDLDLYNRPRSNINMPTGSEYVTFCNLIIAMFAISVGSNTIIYEKQTGKFTVGF